MTQHHQRTTNLLHALGYLQKAFHQRLVQYFDQEKSATPFELLPLTFLEGDGSTFTQFIQHTGLKAPELAVLLLALVPHLQSSFFDNIIAKYLPSGGNFPEISVIKGKNHRSTIPACKADIMLPAFQAQLLSYLKLAGKPKGLLINFHVPVLKQGVISMVTDRYSSLPK